MKDLRRTNSELPEETSGLERRTKELERTGALSEKTREALLESEAEYHTIVESSLVGVYIVQDGLFRFVNKKWCEIYGYRYDEVVDRVSPLDLVHSDDKNIMEENVRKRLSGETGCTEYEIRAIRQDGKTILLKVFGSLMLYKGRPSISGTVIDITKHRRAEEALRTTQMQLSEATDLASIVYWETDPVENVFIFNDPFYALYGTTAEREGGYRMRREEYHKRFIHPDDLPLHHQFVERNTLRPGSLSRATTEHRIIRRDGEIRHMLVRTKIIKDDSGRIVKRYGANQDITERKKVEKALEESEEQFRKMFEGSPIGMVMTGADFHLTRANPAFCQMLGYREHELTSLTFKDITHPDHIAEDVLHVNELISGKIPLYRTEKRYIRKDREIVWGSTRVNMVRGRDGKFLYCLTMIEDITKRKQGEEEKTLLESQLFQSQKMEAIGTLAGGIAHDFNNILTALVGYAALLRMKVHNKTLHTYADQILSASQKATDLIQSLLAFSRQQTASLKSISLHSVLKGTEKLLKRLVTEDIAIKTLLATEDIIIMADATQVDQILFNLTTNARDAMPQGGILTIETRQVTLDDEFKRFHGYGGPGRYALLSVSDTGVGMDKTTRERIFEPFFTTKEVGKGTGLGLSTVYGIVQQHNGYITVKSKPKKGTTFHIYLPVTSETSMGETSILTSMEGGNETILIAEDNETVRDLMRDVLTECGYCVIEATDGAEAVKQFKKAGTIDLLIFDSVMPEKNGREAYDEIHKIKPDTRVIFTSGHSRDVFLDKGIEDKKVNFLQKPIFPDTLLQMVREMLDNGDQA
jgi:two-component system, cell cycle sensor histidine kinase and response regulator CckA